MNRFIFLLLLAGWLPPKAKAQASLDLQLGTSKRDYSFATARLNYQLNGVWRIGAEFQASDYRYRFIDARRIESGYASEVRLFALRRLSGNERIRLDAFTKVGWRSVRVSDDEPQEILYDFQNSTALLIDPGLLVTIKAQERLYFHTGMYLPLVFQTTPEPLGEQLQSNCILFGGSYALGERWAVLATGFTGATFGGEGDTEKYLWQTSVGIRFSLGSSQEPSLVVGY